MARRDAPSPGCTPAGGGPFRVGVLGWPVSHSRSPAMHNAAFAALGMDGWRYQLLPVPPALFATTARGLGQAGLLGANVTIPHKQASLELATSASPAAREIGAANTLTFAPDGAIAAENTDAPGLLAALAALSGVPARPRALVLGAGGSARAAVWALRSAGASEVLVWNRTYARARALAEEFGARAVRSPEPADLLVNCTSVGLNLPESVERSSGDREVLNQLGLTFDQVGEYSNVVDLVYRTHSTPLLAAARAHGAGTVDGQDVLVAQGALSFELWTGVPAPLEVMREAVRDA
ncbi:MAG TPA: shikimate dehydrogenase [Solirubrobacteraceae bacterium]|nr:shikimate dehydrogenase [Solirubrobacteraceae bacterium]